MTENGLGILLGQVENVESCASAELGWYYDDPENPTSVFACESTCETLQTVDVKDVEALFGCATKSVVIRQLF